MASVSRAMIYVLYVISCFIERMVESPSVTSFHPFLCDVAIYVCLLSDAFVVLVVVLVVLLSLVSWCRFVVVVVVVVLFCFLPSSSFF